MIDPYAIGLDITKISGLEAHVMCPFHNDHRPSATFNIDSGLFHCFACGESMPALRLAKALNGYIIPIDVAQLKALAWGSEDEWRWIATCEKAYDDPYLIKRRVTNDEVDRYDIRRCSAGIVFLFKDRFGGLIGGQIRLYRGRMRYMTLGTKPPVWPLKELDNLGNRSMLFVEGIFGAINARRYRAQAFAIIGASAALPSVAMFSSIRDKGIILDNDEAGHFNVCKVLAARLGAWAYCPGLEVDEASKDVIESLPDIYHNKRYVNNHISFLDSANASVVTRELVAKHVARKATIHGNRMQRLPTQKR